VEAPIPPLIPEAACSLMLPKGSQGHGFRASSAAAP
jgi:hypothetical protein